jgi:hypothetical protein
MAVKSTDGFVRAPNAPGAVLNTDIEALKAYKAKKAKAEELDVMKKDVGDMKGKIQNIETMLQQILARLS